MGLNRDERTERPDATRTLIFHGTGSSVVEQPGTTTKRLTSESETTPETGHLQGREQKYQANKKIPPSGPICLRVASSTNQQDDVTDRQCTSLERPFGTLPHKKSSTKVQPYQGRSTDDGSVQILDVAREFVRMFGTESSQRAYCPKVFCPLTCYGLWCSSSSIAVKPYLGYFVGVMKRLLENGFGKEFGYLVSLIW